MPLSFLKSAVFVSVSLKCGQHNFVDRILSHPPPHNPPISTECESASFTKLTVAPAHTTKPTVAAKNPQIYVRSNFPRGRRCDAPRSLVALATAVRTRRTHAKWGKNGFLAHIEVLEPEKNGGGPRVWTEKAVSPCSVRKNCTVHTQRRSVVGEFDFIFVRIKFDIKITQTHMNNVQRVNLTTRSC